MITKKDKRIRRHIKIRTRINGTKDMPRLCVWRSLNHIYARIIDDENGKVLASVSDLDAKGAKAKKENKTLKAKEAGKLIAKKAMEKKIEKVVFDRGGIIYHGRIKALAEGAREGGLKF